jgi:hypothetical protein
MASDMTSQTIAAPAKIQKYFSTIASLAPTLPSSAKSLNNASMASVWKCSIVTMTTIVTARFVTQIANANQTSCVWPINAWENANCY